MGASKSADWPISIEIPVPWRDIDAAGHVNNAVYFSYFETARLAVFMGPMGMRTPRDLTLIVARAECDYVTPASMGETLVVRVWTTRIGTTSFDFAYEAREKETGRVVARGKTVQVMFDYAKGEKMPVSPTLRAILENGLPAAEKAVTAKD